MAKKITIDIEVNGKMQKATVSAKKLRSALDDVDSATERTGKGTRTLDRNLKGAAKTTSNSTKEFSKMSQGMGGLVGAYATVAASVFALSAAFQFFKTAADLAALSKGQELFAERTGVSMKLMTSNIQDATGGLVAFKEAAQAAAIGQAAGLTADQLERLGKVAKNAGTILGRDVTDSFNRLTRGAIKAEPELLDELGIIIRIDRASQDYAATINKNAKDLTQFEKTQAVVNAVLEQGSQKFADVGNNVNQVAKFGAAFQDAFKKLSEPVAAVANFMAGALQDSILAVTASMGLLAGGILKSFAPAGPAFKNTAEAGVAARKRIADAVQQGTQKGIAADIRAGKFTEANLKAVERAHRIKSNTVVDLSRTERLAIERDIAIIRAQTARMTAEGGNMMQKMIGGWSSQLNMFVADYGKKMGYVKFITAGASAILSKFFAAAAIAAMLVMVIELGKQFRRAFLISPQLRAAEEATENMTKAVDEQIKSVREVEAGMEEATSKAHEFSRSFGLITNINLNPVRAQVNGLRKAISELDISSKKVSGDLFSGRFGDGRSDLGGAENQARIAFDRASAFSGGGFGRIQSVEDLNAAIKQQTDLVDELTRKQAKEAHELNATGKIVQSVSNYFGELGDARRALKFLREGQDTLQLPVVRDMEGADVAKEYLEGLPSAIKLFREEAALLEGTGMNLTDFNEAKFKDLEALITAANASFEGTDVEAFKDALEAVEQAFVDTTKKGQKFIDSSSRVVAAFKGISTAVADFQEGEREFLPEGSQFAPLLDGLKEAQNNFKTLATEIDGFSGMSIADIIAKDGRTDEQSQAILTALRLANKLRGEGTKEITQQAKIEELMDALGLRRTEIIKQQVEQEHLITESKIKQKKELRTSTKIQANLINAVAKEEQAEIAVNQAMNQKTREMQAQEKIDENRLRQLNNQIKMAEEDLELSRQQTAIQRNLLPILREQLDIQNEMSELNILGEQQKLLSQQIAGRKTILDLTISQIEKDNALRIAQAQSENPFFDRERAVAESTAAINLAFLTQRSKQAEDEFNLKMKEIDLEYQLLEAKNKSAKLQFEAKAAEIAEDGPDKELRDTYLELAKLQGQVSEGFKEAKALAQQIAEETKNASLADLERMVKDSELILKNLEPANQVLQDAGKAFSGSVGDAFNAIFASINDSTIDLSEKMKDIGRNLLNSIQQAMTKRYLVDPLMNFLDLGEEDPAVALKDAIDLASAELKTRAETGINNGATKVEAAGTNAANKLKTAVTSGGQSAATEIRNAIKDLELKIKVDCCDSDPLANINRPVAPAVAAAGTTTLDTSLVPAPAPSLFDPIVKPQLDPLMPKPQPPGLEALNSTNMSAPLNTGPAMLGGLGTAPTVELGTATLASLRGEEGMLGEGQSPLSPTIGSGPGDQEGDGDGEGTQKETNGLLGELNTTMAMQVLGTTASIAALTGNSEIAEKLQRVMMAIQIVQGVSNLLTKLKTKSEMLNTKGEALNTGAIYKLIAALFTTAAVPGKTGIYPPLGYAAGGIAKGPRSGYPAVLHGNEAVVPLPDGKTIPVDLGDSKIQGGGQQNNVVVNVSVDNQGQSKTDSSQSDSQKAGELGAAISMAVQKELQSQKRPGGILSPYGVT